MKLSKSQERLLEKLRNTPAEDLSPEDLEDLEELEQLEKQEEKEEDPAPVNDLSDLKKGMEEILKCLKPKETTPQEKVEIPTPAPVITKEEVDQLNQEQTDQQDQPIQESKLKRMLKAIW